MRISDWSSDVCSSDLGDARGRPEGWTRCGRYRLRAVPAPRRPFRAAAPAFPASDPPLRHDRSRAAENRSEEHTSELQSLMRISYAVFCLKKKKKTKEQMTDHHNRQQQHDI